MKYTLSIAVAVSFVCAGCATRGLSGYEVISHVVSLNTQQQSAAGNLFPWEREDRAVREPHALEDVVVSNGCGFVQFVYATGSLKDYLIDPVKVTWSPTTYLVLAGEWCRVAPYVFEEPTLAHFRSYGGTRYLIDGATILKDEGGSPYVEDWRFISAYKSDIHGSQSLQDPRCCPERLYLRDLHMPANNRMERTRER